ncbi:MAG: MBL fold metallo-hydrolase [Bacteroidota bacterium]|jgi:glyoxylase-like metal-dependent hydrolase (beta-lactamase superfamily II)
MKSFKPLLALLLLWYSIPFSHGQTNMRHLEIQKITDGVYAAIHRNGGHGICNAGIIDLGDATVIFDCMLTPAAAMELKDAAKELTGREAKYVVNSHYHNDHIRGNQVFTNATIISTNKTAELIKTRGPEELASDRRDAAERLQGWRSKPTSNDPHAEKERLGMIGYYEALASSAKDIVITRPNATFNGSMSLNGTLRSVELIDMGAGHTPSDAVLWLPNEKILFAGDLLFVETQPWMLDGDPENWLRILERISDMQPETIIPGHGPVANNEAIDPLRAYIRTVMDAASQVANGKNDKLQCPAPYDRWMLSVFYFPNVMGMAERSGQKEKSR